MSADTGTQSISTLLEDLVAEAVGRDVPAEIARAARDITRKAIKAPEAPVSGQTARRVEAYFQAVVRRRSVRRSGSPRAAARFVLATVVADLAACGRSGSDIWTELERGWAATLPAEVLEEYRLQLCG